MEPGRLAEAEGPEGRGRSLGMKKEESQGAGVPGGKGEESFQGGGATACVTPRSSVK